MSKQLPVRQWRCVLCGYIHAGSEPPGCCPVCGTGPEDFEAYAAPDTDGTSDQVPARWRCLLCNDVHEGSAPPDPCPVCGAEPECFQAVESEIPTAVAAPTTDSTLRLVIVGSGIAGVAAAEAARAAAPGAEITLVSSEQDLPYYRLNLTRYLAGEITRDALPIHPETWYGEQRVRLLRGEQVVQLDTAAHTVSLANGATLPYDRLILTAGSHPHIPPLPGIDLDGVFSLRTAADADGLLARLTPGTPCVCIGGGVLGIETAAALAKRGATVTLLEGHDWLMPRQLNATAAVHLERHLNKLGVTVLKRARAEALEGGNVLEAVQLLDGRRLHARLGARARPASATPKVLKAATR